MKKVRLKQLFPATDNSWMYAVRWKSLGMVEVNRMRLIGTMEVGWQSYIYEQLQMLDSNTAELEASKILQGLGFTEEMQRRQTRSFIGGWRMRI